MCVESQEFQNRACSLKTLSHGSHLCGVSQPDWSPLDPCGPWKASPVGTRPISMSPDASVMLQGWDLTLTDSGSPHLIPSLSPVISKGRLFF